MPQLDAVPTAITPVEPKTEAELLEVLKRHNIPLDAWGKGSAKTPDDLFTEIREGETKLFEKGRELIIRNTNVLGINVFCKIDGKLFKMRESKQVFNDGRTRVRDLSTSLGEKLHEAESRTDAVKRALQEELSVPPETEYSFVEGAEEVGELKESSSYPGIWSNMTLYRFDVLIPSSEYQRLGEHTEIQQTKKTYFTWYPVETLPQTLTSFLASYEDQGTQRP